MGSTKNNVIDNSLLVSDAIIGTCRINVCTPAELSLPGEYFTQNVYGSTVQYVLAVLMSSCRAGNNTKLSGGTRIEMCSDKIAGKSFLEGFECILVGFSLNELCALVCALSIEVVLLWWGNWGWAGCSSSQLTSEAFDDFWAFRMAATVSSVGLIPFAEIVCPKDVISGTPNLHLSPLGVGSRFSVLPRPCWDYDHAPVGFSQRHVVWYISHPGAALEIVELNVGIFLGPQKHQTWAACSDTGQCVWQISCILLIARQVQSYDTPY